MTDKVIDFPEAEVKKPLTADDILREAAGRFPVVLVIGLNEDGKTLDFATNMPQYTFMQWLLQKAAFELNIHERNNQKTVDAGQSD